MKETGKINEELVAELLNTGYELKNYPEQGIQTYAKTISIFEFMNKYGRFAQFALESNNEIVELLGDSVTIEYVPSIDSAQWTTHNFNKNSMSPDYMEYQIFRFDEDVESAMQLLKLFA